MLKNILIYLKGCDSFLYQLQDHLVVKICVEFLQTNHGRAARIQWSDVADGFGFVARLVSLSDLATNREPLVEAKRTTFIRGGRGALGLKRRQLTPTRIHRSRAFAIWLRDGGESRRRRRATVWFAREG